MKHLNKASGRPMPPTVVLASSSPYRKQLLQRLLQHFAICSPDIDETPLENELVLDMVKRLTAAKLSAVAVAVAVADNQARNTIVIASDQAAEWRGKPVNKPGSFAAACEQLAMLSGQTVDFHTGLAVSCRELNYSSLDIVTTRVTYRTLTTEQITNYLNRENAWDCVGSSRCEGLGISLLASIQTDDPTALIGLPLIRLTTRLQETGVSLI